MTAMENTFQAIAEEWARRHFVNKAPAHKARVVARLEKNVYPYIGANPVADITPADILRVIQLIEKRGAIETAHRALQNISQVMRYAVATCRLIIDHPFAAGRPATRDAVAYGCSDDTRRSCRIPTRNRCFHGRTSCVRCLTAAAARICQTRDV